MVTAVIGKGGVGKTTVTALLLKQLLAARKTPILAIDADPSSCLAPVVGLEVETTLGELRDVVRDDDARPEGMSKQDWLGMLAEEAISEQRGFDLLTMGHPEGPGCYCFVNNVLRDHLERLQKTYAHVLVDCEAGQEHLSRRTTRVPDLLVCVVNSSRMAAETVRRSLHLFAGLHGSIPARVDLVLNGFDAHAPTDELAALAAGDFSFTHVWRVPRDPAVSDREVAGASLLELPDDTPAVAALAGWADTL